MTNDSTTPRSSSAAAADGKIQPPFDLLAGQPLIARYLSSICSEQSACQAYLFAGPAGAGKVQAALLLAEALICRQAGGDNCPDCQRTRRQSHPDLHILVPEGASGYLAEQMQELIRDASLAPMEAARKVYIITQAERMTVTFANAFLKTLEEPPASVVFVLISRSLDAVLPTIRSRCQAVLFGSLPESHAIQLLVSELAVDVQRATLALSISAGSIQEAKAFLLSESRHAARRELMIVLRNLQQLDSLDILAAVRDLLMANKIPLDELRIAQERELATARDSLSKSALASLEQSQKREITAAERAGLRFNLQMIRSWLRDLLAILTGQPTTIVNYDEAEAIQLLAKSTDLASLLRCLEATNEAWENLDYNVSVQLIFEYLLFTLRDELGERS